jgi:hypothetical protein
MTRLGDSENLGGGRGIQTPDSLVANQMLYQLSYTPKSYLARPEGFKPPTNRVEAGCSIH